MPATAFITKLYQMLNDAESHDTETYAVVSWGLTKDSVLIKEQGALGTRVLPRYFKHGNVSSFVRQLNMYGFRKRAAKTMEFYSPLFMKDRPDLLDKLQRAPVQRSPRPSTKLLAKLESRMVRLEGEQVALRRENEALRSNLAELRLLVQHKLGQLLSSGEHYTVIKSELQPAADNKGDKPDSKNGNQVCNKVVSKDGMEHTSGPSTSRQQPPGSPYDTDSGSSMKSDADADESSPTECDAEEQSAPFKMVEGDFEFFEALDCEGSHSHAYDGTEPLSAMVLEPVELELALMATDVR